MNITSDAQCLSARDGTKSRGVHRVLDGAGGDIPLRGQFRTKIVQRINSRSTDGITIAIHHSKYCIRGLQRAVVLQTGKRGRG